MGNDTTYPDFKFTRKGTIKLVRGGVTLAEHATEFEIIQSAFRNGPGVYSVQFPEAELITPGTVLAPAPNPSPAPPPPPPVPHPPDPPLGTLEAKPNNIQSQTTEGPSDWVDTAKILPPTPWHVFADTYQTIAPSMQGGIPTAYRRLHVFGHQNKLYQGTPLIADGQIQQLYPQFGDFVEGQLKGLATYPLRGGPRERHVMTPYCTWHGHTRVKSDGSLATSPHVPLWIGITMDGWMVYLFRDGSAKLAFKVPLQTYSYDFTYFEPRESGFFFAVDTGAGRVLKVDRRDATLGQTTVLCSGFKRATSIRQVGTDLYVCDPDDQGGSVWRVDPTTGQRSLVCKIPQAFWIDYTRNGDLVVMTLERKIHRVDIASGIISPDLLGRSGEQLWVQCSVDRTGAAGERDSIAAISSHGVSNTDFFIIDSTGKVDGRFPSQGKTSVGRTLYTHETTGHYPWVVDYHPDEALIMVQGFANVQPMLLQAGHLHEWPQDDVYDHNLLGRGYNVLKGGAGGPSFNCLINTSGGSQLCSSDAIAKMDYADAVEFVRQGMVGSTARPGLAGDDLKAMMYLIYRNSQRYLAEGRPLITNLFSYLSQR